MSEIDLSIIIPHWQNAADLRRLLASIPDNERFETIVVDDYSGENCFGKVEALKNNFRFTLLKNTGKKSAGTCRNIGLANACGKWVLFADADDFFLDSLKEEFYRHFDSDCDIVFFPPKSIYSDSGEPGIRHQVAERLIHNYIRGRPDAEKELRYSFVSPCSKMLQRTFLNINNCRFDEVLAANDVYFSVTSGYAAEKIGVSTTPIYCITMTTGSLTNNVSYPVLESRILTCIKRNSFLKFIGENNRASSVVFFLYEARHLGLTAMIRLFFLVIRLGGNPFIGWRRWLKTYKRCKQHQKTYQKYRTVSTD